MPARPLSPPKGDTGLFGSETESKEWEPGSRQTEAPIGAKRAISIRLANAIRTLSR
jgi:hypothetical protein